MATMCRQLDYFTPRLENKKLNNHLKLQSRGSLSARDSSIMPFEKNRDVLQRAAKLETQIQRNGRLRVFVSYHPKYRAEDVRQLADRLETKGFAVWLNRSNKAKAAEENQLQKLLHPDELYHTDVFIAFISEAYVASRKCEAEASQALSSRKLVVVVNLESLIITKRHWYEEKFRNCWRLIDFTSPKHLEQAVENVIQEINRQLDPKSEPFELRIHEHFRPVNVPKLPENCSKSRPDLEALLLKELLTTCSNPDEGILAVSGPHGVGKTTILSKVFHNQTEDFKFGLIRKTAVFWFNATILEHSSDREELIVELLSEASNLPRTEMLSAFLDRALPYFEARSERVLFVFDNVVNLNLLKEFQNLCRPKFEPALCLICSDPMPIALEDMRHIRKVMKVGPMVLDETKALLASGFELNSKLSFERILKLSELCLGNAYLANLVGTLFRNCPADQSQRFFEGLTSERNYCHNNPARFASLLMDLTLSQNAQLCLIKLVLFDPDEPIGIDYLPIFWPGHSHRQCRDLIDTLVDAKFLLKLDSGSFQVPKLIHEASILSAARLFSMSDSRNVNLLQNLRVRLATKEPVMLFLDLLRRQMAELLRHLLMKLDAESLVKICQHDDECGKSFLQTLYRTKWYQPFDGRWDSFMLIAEILERINQKKLVLAATNNRTADCFLMEVFDDEAKLAEVQPFGARIVQLLEPYRLVYLEKAWQRDLTQVNAYVLMQAILDNNFAAFKALIPDSSELGDAFVAAARCNRLEMVQEIFQSNAHLINFHDEPMGESALTIAATFGHIKVVEFLAEKSWQLIKADRNGEGKTGAWLAANFGHFEIFRYFVELEPKLAFVENHDGANPLWAAAQRGHADMVSYLLERYENDQIEKQDEFGRSCLWIAAANGHSRVVELLAQRCPNLLYSAEDELKTPLFVATENGHSETAELIFELLKREVKNVFLKDDNGTTGFWFAARNGHFKIVKFLVENGGGKKLAGLADNFGKTPLWAASWQGHHRIVRYLCRLKPKLASKPDSNSTTPIFMAATFGHLDTVRLLYEKAPKAVWVAESDQQLTPFWSALRHGHLAVVEFLYNKGYQRDPHREPPLWQAIKSQRLELVKYFHEKEPESLMRKDELGRTSVWLAAKSGNIEIARYLLNFVSFLVDQDSDGNTPLHVAIEAGHDEMTAMLIKMEPNVRTLQNNAGLKPVDLAKRVKLKQETIAALKKK